MDWIIEQKWRHVLFLHWKIPADLLSGQVPFEIDLFEGEAVISIVPFRMEKIRFPYSISVPFFSSLWELNLRTYVKVNGVSGIYFLTLDTDSRLGQWIAQHVFHLPYRVAKIEAKQDSNLFQFKSSFQEFNFELIARLSEVEKIKTPLEIWATERYSLFVLHQNEVFRGRVKHEPWKLKSFEVLKLENTFSDQFQIPLMHPWAAASYCEELKVRFVPFERIALQS